MTVVTRFAPSPTGVLHTGSARTALFCYLYAKHHSGKMLLRIEDTDKERSKDVYTKAIFEELKWLGIEWDGDAVMQSSRVERHKEVAHQLLKNGAAYKCYTSQEEIEKFRENHPNQKFHSAWRDRSDEPEGAPYVIRLKSPDTGVTVVEDLIMGRIEVNNQEVDDMVLLRSDGTPTYMLAVVVDDHDMGVTHIIRGDDHLTNAFRQTHIHQGMGWDVPAFGHMPLIHDKHGKKLSKRAGALGVDEYRKLGYLPEAVVNHLLRLGWSHGDDEIISMGQAIDWFDTPGIGKSPARFDIEKLNHINAYYIKNCDEDRLFDALIGYLEDNLSTQVLSRIRSGLSGLKDRAQTLKDLAASAYIYIAKHEMLDDKSKSMLESLSSALESDISDVINNAPDWSQQGLHEAFSAVAHKHDIKLPVVMQTLRALLLGTSSSPGIFGVMEILGQDECKVRFK